MRPALAHADGQQTAGCGVIAGSTLTRHHESAGFGVSGLRLFPCNGRTAREIGQFSHASLRFQIPVNGHNQSSLLALEGEPPMRAQPLYGVHSLVLVGSGGCQRPIEALGLSSTIEAEQSQPDWRDAFSPVVHWAFESNRPGLFVEGVKPVVEPDDFFASYVAPPRLLFMISPSPVEVVCGTRVQEPISRVVQAVGASHPLGVTAPNASRHRSVGGAGRAAPNLLDRAASLAGQRGGRVVDAPLDVRLDVSRPSAVADDLGVRPPEVLIHPDASHVAGLCCHDVRVGVSAHLCQQTVVRRGLVSSSIHAMMVHVCRSKCMLTPERQGQSLPTPPPVQIAHRSATSTCPRSPHDH